MPAEPEPVTAEPEPPESVPAESVPVESVPVEPVTAEPEPAELAHAEVEAAKGADAGSGAAAAGQDGPPDARFGNPSFFERWADQPLGAVSGTVALQASGPEGKLAATLSFDDGALAEVMPGAARDADLALEAPWPLAADLFSGNADPAVAYMSGDLKVSGDMALWLDLLPAWRAHPAHP